MYARACLMGPSCLELFWRKTAFSKMGNLGAKTCGKQELVNAKLR